MACLKSQYFTLRSLVPDDAVRDWSNWLADPATAAALNSVPRPLGEADQLRHVSSMDNKAFHLLGMEVAPNLRDGEQHLRAWPAIEATKDYRASQPRTSRRHRNTCR